MRAVAVTPGKQHSARVLDVPTPTAGPGEVRVKVLHVGIDGTDIEIDRAEYGEAPPGQDFLIIGHESFGVIDAVGAGVREFKPGDSVVAMVRRPDDCGPCKSGEPDMCIKGQYTERGIKGRHGYMAEYYVEAPEYLVRVPPELREVAVLLEPVSVVEKGVRHAWAIQGRMRDWQPKRALVLGAGPVGLLAAMLVRLRGLETIVYSRRPSPAHDAKVQELGGRHVAKLDERGQIVNHLGALPEKFGPFDFLFEATGAPSATMGAMRIIGPDGVLCLASVTGGESPMEICASCLNMDLVLGNRVVFGTVNANRVDFENGVRDMARSLEQWPGWLARMITRRLPLDRFREGFERSPGDMKVVVEV